mmetsp:Transcript_118651/g.206619  ORF Transcript_118651/g.206619 Transcript_118651/m.206619 type:complete len:206 (+) Transcript_118651:591-1208(+)
MARSIVFILCRWGTRKGAGPGAADTLTLMLICMPAMRVVHLFSGSRRGPSAPGAMPKGQHWRSMGPRSASITSLAGKAAPLGPVSPAGRWPSQRCSHRGQPPIALQRRRGSDGFSAPFGEADERGLGLVDVPPLHAAAPLLLVAFAGLVHEVLALPVPRLLVLHLLEAVLQVVRQRHAVLAGPGGRDADVRHRGLQLGAGLRQLP